MFVGDLVSRGTLIEGKKLPPQDTCAIDRDSTNKIWSEHDAKWLFEAEAEAILDIVRDMP